MRSALCLVLAGCVGHGHTPAPANRSAPGPGEPLPCGARTIDELDPERASATISTTCRVVEHDPTRLYEGSRLIVESDAHGALVAFDPRVPGPRGIRVGHTGRDVERLASDYTELRCDPSGGERTLCLFESRRDHELECDNTGVGGITLYFGAAPEVVGARAREVLRHRKVVAVQVRDPVCTGD